MFDITNVMTNVSNSIEININVDIPKEYLEKASILELKDVTFVGSISKVIDYYNIKGLLKGIMILPDDVTLERVSIPFRVEIDTDFGENTTRIKDLKFCPSDDIGVNVKDRLEDYVRKDEFEDLINKMNELYNTKVADKDDVGDAFRLLSRRLSEGNKKKNENSFLNYEKEVVGYELL